MRNAAADKRRVVLTPGRAVSFQPRLCGRSRKGTKRVPRPGRYNFSAGSRWRRMSSGGVGVVVQEPLLPAYMADRPEGRAADLTRTFRYGVGGGKDLIGLFVGQPVIIAKVRARHVANGNSWSSRIARTYPRAGW